MYVHNYVDMTRSLLLPIFYKVLKQLIILFYFFFQSYIVE